MTSLTSALGDTGGASVGCRLRWTGLTLCLEGFGLVGTGSAHHTRVGRLISVVTGTTVGYKLGRIDHWKSMEI